MDVKLLHDSLEVPQHPLGFHRVLPLLGHLLDKTALLGDACIALGDVPVGQGKMFSFLLRVGHGSGENAPSPTKELRISQDAL